MSPKRPYILLDDQVAGSRRLYQDPVEIITAQTPDEVGPAMDRLQRRIDTGLHAAGYFSYELGYVLEKKLLPLLPENRSAPLLQFGLFGGFDDRPPDPEPCAERPDITLFPEWTEADYAKRFEKVLGYIRAGDVYQINLTFPMRARYAGDSLALYNCLRERQPGRYGGIIALDESGDDIITLSPELFFQVTGNYIELRPMKGTIKRVPDAAADAALRDSLRADLKSQAENLMIVDLLRNDVSRIAEKASVSVPDLFTVETYPTLHTMTSTVTAQLGPDISIADMVQSLFPCGSVTGAPKIRAMEIIRELEETPRGAYCGAIGYIDPGGESCFNVAIRTIQRRGDELTYNVGGGVVLDSQAASEYAECWLKAKVMQRTYPDLIETMKWTPESGVIRQALHQSRMSQAARELGYDFSSKKWMSFLDSISGEGPKRVRLTLSRDGKFDLTVSDFTEIPTPLRLAISENPLRPEIQNSRHKTTARAFYDGERQRLAALTGCDEVLFLGEKGELCEGSFTNLFLKTGDQLLTPDLQAGGLPGVLRQDLVARKEAVEKTLFLPDLLDAKDIFMGNSLRGLMPTRLVDPRPL